MLHITLYGMLRLVTMRLKSTSAQKKATSFGEDLIEGMKLVLAHQTGKVDLEQGLAQASGGQVNSQEGEASVKVMRRRADFSRPL